MSRTIRRKGMKYPTGWYSLTKERFDEWKVDYLSGDWRGIRSYTWTHPYTGRVTTHTYKAKWHHREVSQHETFEAYTNFTEAWFHSDAGHPVHNHQISASFRRCIEKKYRSQRNQQLKSALIRGEEEDLMLTPFRHDIAWWW
ncbi:hypothetical protein D3C73_513150 [compost metagenome]